jgi:hypothetical protein
LLFSGCSGGLARLRRVIGIEVRSIRKEVVPTDVAHIFYHKYKEKQKSSASIWGKLTPFQKGTYPYPFLRLPGMNVWGFISS